MHIIRKGDYRERALKYEKTAHTYQEKLNFEYAGEYFYKALVEWLFINEHKHALRALVELYRNSYAKICKYLLDEQWDDIPPMVENNLQGYRKMLDLVKNSEIYLEYFQYIGNTILSACQNKNIYMLSGILIKDEYLGQLFTPLRKEILKQLEVGYAYISSIKQKFYIEYKAVVNYVKILIHNQAIEGIINNSETIIYTNNYVKNVIAEHLEQL
ncbi:MAG: hypothetical protein DRJ52_06185 [Thermoprotei archaeon]|nr:MAG: hypothetical protein DRJ52_06185 [Thermoprotei archaeon]